jgi:hypothetical protein
MRNQSLIKASIGISSIECGQRWDMRRHPALNVSWLLALFGEQATIGNMSWVVMNNNFVVVQGVNFADNNTRVRRTFWDFLTMGILFYVLLLQVHGSAKCRRWF